MQEEHHRVIKEGEAGHEAGETSTLNSLHFLDLIPKSDTGTRKMSPRGKA